MLRTTLRTIFCALKKRLFYCHLHCHLHFCHPVSVVTSLVTNSLVTIILLLAPLLALALLAKKYRLSLREVLREIVFLCVGSLAVILPRLPKIIGFIDSNKINSK